MEYRKDDVIVFLDMTKAFYSLWGDTISIPEYTEARVLSDLGEELEVRVRQTIHIPDHISGSTLRVAKGRHIALSGLTMVLNERQKYIRAMKNAPRLFVFDQWVYQSIQRSQGPGEKLFGAYWAVIDNPEFPWRVHATDPTKSYGPIYTSPPMFPPEKRTCF